MSGQSTPARLAFEELVRFRLPSAVAERHFPRGAVAPTSPKGFRCSI